MKEVDDLLDAAEENLAAAREKLRAQEPVSLRGEKDVPVKFEAPAALAREIRIRAAERGITLKRYFLELLAADGFDIDLASIPTDGRRDR